MASINIETSYERSARLAKRIKNNYVQTKVSPEWVEDGGRFWYRRNIRPGQFSFILVDAAKGVRCPAFNHEQLVERLKERGIDAKAEALPFKWIDLSKDTKSIKFCIDDKKLEFRDDGALIDYNGELSGATLRPMPEEKPSEWIGEATTVKFTNRTTEPIRLMWVTYEGDVKKYATVEPEQSDTRKTYAGHVWRVENAKTNAMIASFIAVERDSIAIINEGMTAMTKKVDKSKQPARRPRDRSSQTKSKIIPSESRTFVRDNNVWLRHHKAIQLSTGGTKENPFDDDLYPSPDGKFVVAWQYTPEQEHLIHEIQSSPKDRIEPRLKSFQYLKPGDKVRMDRPRMFDLATKIEVASDNTLFHNPYCLELIGWNSGGDEFRFLYNQRGHQILRVLGMNTHGVVRTLIEETSKTFVDWSTKNLYHDLKDSNELIWASERDGWNHLYLFDSSAGKLKSRITKGEWIMRSVDRIDKEKRRVWFTAFGLVANQDPYYAQLARVNLDGSDLTILTEGDGTHTWKWSLDSKYLVDEWSRVDLPPQIVLRDGETGKAITVLEEGNLNELVELGWTVPERFAAPGRDGQTLIYGIIIRPSVFDPTKKYPVIEQIYAGPHRFSVPKGFSTLIEEHELTELGFVVVLIDGMGTNWRSKAFHDRCYKDLKDAGLPDRIAWIKAAAESRAWMDTTRVGIYGGSAGGQNAMGALLFHGDFYKVAIADSGCHDNRMDKMWWSEQWMGWPVDKSYEDSSNVIHVAKLTGALMLVVGELDTNVDPASTMQVVNALNEAGKDYDLLFIPNGKHFAGVDSSYALRRQRDFFVRHLAGIEPPKRNST